MMLGDANTRVVREAKSLIARARRAERVVPAPARPALSDLATRLHEALGRDDLDAVKRLLPELDAALDREPMAASRKPFSDSIWVAIGIALFIRAFAVEAFKIPSSSMVPTLEIGDHLFVNKLPYGVWVPFGDKLWTFDIPNRGDIFVFRQPCTGQDFIKRVVALPGDKVEVRCGVLYLNGVAAPRQTEPGPCSFVDEDQGDSAPARPCLRHRETIGGHTFEVYTNVTPHAPSDFPSVTRAAELPRCMDPVRKPPIPAELIQLPPNPDGDVCAQQLQYVVPQGFVFAMGDNRDNSNDSRFWGPVPTNLIKGRAVFTYFSHSSYRGYRIRWNRIGRILE